MPALARVACLGDRLAQAQEQAEARLTRMQPPWPPPQPRLPSPASVGGGGLLFPANTALLELAQVQVQAQALDLQQLGEGLLLAAWRDLSQTALPRLSASVSSAQREATSSPPIATAATAAAVLAVGLAGNELPVRRLQPQRRLQTCAASVALQPVQALLGRCLYRSGAALTRTLRRTILRRLRAQRLRCRLRTRLQAPGRSAWAMCESCFASSAPWLKTMIMMMIMMTAISTMERTAAANAGLPAAIAVAVALASVPQEQQCPAQLLHLHEAVAVSLRRRRRPHQLSQLDSRLLLLPLHQQPLPLPCPHRLEKREGDLGRLQLVRLLERAKAKAKARPRLLLQLPLLLAQLLHRLAAAVAPVLAFGTRALLAAEILVLPPAQALLLRRKRTCTRSAWASAPAAAQLLARGLSSWVRARMRMCGSTHSCSSTNSSSSVLAYRRRRHS